MGSTNHGTQSIRHQYFDEITGTNRGERLLDIMPPGIYWGGYLTKVSDSEVALSTLVAEISDGTNQISVRTAASATLNSTTLDSGAISSGTPYLVLRWAYSETVNNYVEVHALSSLNGRQQNDVVIGKCVFAGAVLDSFDYSDRTFPLIMNRNLQVLPTTDAELYVRIRGGYFNNGTQTVKVGDQKSPVFTAPTGGNSRIDLVYITYDGTVAIQQGTAAPSPSAPSYLGKLVLAEVRLATGDTDIAWDRITDVRAFLSHPALPDESTIGISSGGRLYNVNDTAANTYDSGWFTVSAGGSYVKSHNLGSYALRTTVLFAPDSGGSPNLTKIAQLTDITGDVGVSLTAGVQIKSITSSQFTVQANATYVGVILGSGGTPALYSNGHYRVIATKVV